MTRLDRRFGRRVAACLATALMLLGTLRGAASTVGAGTSGATDYLVRVWETEHGLPERSATAVVQTPDGAIWLGTFNGLVRFNGAAFTVLNSHNTPGLPSPSIVNLHVDRFGRIWVSTFEGLVLRDGAEWIPMPSVKPSDYVRTFSERPNGEVLITTFNGRIQEFPPPQPGRVHRAAGPRRGGDGVFRGRG